MKLSGGAGDGLHPMNTSVVLTQSVEKVHNAMTNPLPGVKYLMP